MYYTSFVSLIVIPILIVLVFVLLFLNKQFGQKGIENIRQSQETIVSELEMEIKNSSIRLSHLVHVNDNEIMNVAAQIDGATIEEKYRYERAMIQTVNFVIEPIKDIASVTFYTKNGDEVFFRSENRIPAEVWREEEWFENAKETKNQVYVGSYNVGGKNELFLGGERNALILIYAISPDNKIDRQGKVEMVCAYQNSKVANRIKRQNADYLNKKNTLGITRIVDQEGNYIYADNNVVDIATGKISVRTPLAVNNSTWYVESFVNNGELTRDFMFSAMVAMVAAIAILLLAAYFSRFFINGIVRPVDNIKDALKQVEDGNMDVTIDVGGTWEIRQMSHQFNAMTRRLTGLVAEYEEKVNMRIMNEEELFIRLLRCDVSPEEVKRRNRDFYNDSYVLLCIKQKSNSYNLVEYLKRNARFVSRCMYYEIKQGIYICYYRIHESEYESKLIHMIEDLQKSVKQEQTESFATCISGVCDGIEGFSIACEEIKKYIVAECLLGEDVVIDLARQKSFWEEIFELSLKYENLAEAVYLVDEKNVIQGKKALFESFKEEDFSYSKKLVYATILALEKQFVLHEESIIEVLGQGYNYIGKMDRIVAIRNLKLWTTNYFAWIMEYSSTKLNIDERDVIIKAKRYIANNYDNPDMKLHDVAEHVGLNEKYFTNRFSKEAGETFSNYLMSVRIEKAKELLKTTDFKVYEIAMMVGYHNAEHFTRTFKKILQVSPNQYRKTKETS